MKFDLSLSRIFDACRKAVYPTPEEKAEKQRRLQIRELSLDLARAVRGVKIGEYTQDDMRAYSAMTAGFPMTPHIPVKLVPLSDIQKEWHIRDFSEKLLKLGVSQSEIEGVIVRSEEDMRNPRNFDFPPSY